MPAVEPHSDSQFHAAVQRLLAGGVVAFPTETVYGLGADATQPEAVARIFEIKGRPRFDPLIVHVPSRAAAELVADFSPQADALARRFWPGPLTLVLPRKPYIPDLVSSGLPTVAVRIPSHPLALALLEAVGRPVAAPSANPFGMISPTRAEHVAAQLGDQVDLILDGGPCSVGVESTVLALLPDEPPRLLRPGGVPLEDLVALLGPIEVGAPVYLEHPPADAPRLAPGMLVRHYAPRTRLVLLDPAELDLLPIPSGDRVGLLTLLPPADPDRFTAVEVLSPTGDLRQAASRLFASLRTLDALPLDWIAAHRFPSTGLGLALNDRLQRASS